MFPRLRSQAGQASVELVAVLPFVLLVGLVLWQLAVAGEAVWLCGNAARVAARAEAVGRSGLEAARSAVPAGLRDGLRVKRDAAGRVRVRLAVPILVHAWRAPLDVAATAKLPSGGGS
jgi:pilus assembly protein CpaE